MASQTETSYAHAPAHTGLGHVVPVWLLAAVFGGLLVLTCATVAVSYVDLGNMNLYLAMGIAAAKASLVVLFFMHLFWDRPFNSMVFIGCLLFVSLFIGISLTDMRASSMSRSAARARRCRASIRRWGASRSERRPGEPRFVRSGWLDARADRHRDRGNGGFPRGPDDVLCGQHRDLPADAAHASALAAADFPALPATLWLSTLDILFSSITIQGAVRAARSDDKVGLRRNLAAALVLGLGFLGLQSYAWYKIWTQVTVAADLSSTYLQMFYALTGLHAVHVLGGLVPLAMVTVAAYQGLYGRKKNAAVRYTAIYWHFLAAVWCVVFTVVYLL